MSSFQSATPILTIIEVSDLRGGEKEEMLEVTTFMMEMRVRKMHGPGRLLLKQHINIDRVEATASRVSIANSSVLPRII